MQRRGSSSIHSLRTALAITAAVLGGCTPATLSSGSSPRVASAGAATVSVATPYLEAHTLSLGLDRIDQRTLPLDQTFRRHGSGRGVTVYVFDGGLLDTHPELAGRVRRGYDAFPGEEHVCNAHGTAVAGAVAGSSLGVAPDVELVDVKMVECRRLRGSIDAIVRGTQWVLEDQARHPERRAVANWSFVADTSSAIPALDSAAAALEAAGIPVIVSAGNVDLNACHISPANAPGVIVVGASHVLSRSDSARAPLMEERVPGTAWGRCIDVFAPGDSVMLPGFDGAQRPIRQLWTGTSMSAGYVSGAVALYLEAHPLASAADVREYVREMHGVRVDRRSRGGMLSVGAGGTQASY